ncbi:MAG: HesA/MoeB/ThiF family protein [Myxococcota bacterium]
MRLTLERDSAAEFVGLATRWCVLLDNNYPFGRVSFYPAADGGLTATFPHQLRNTANPDRDGWRGGRLCLDTPFGGERLLVIIRDPVGDADGRLRWHAERALTWLNRAANNQLLAQGDPFEIPDRPHTTVRGRERERVIHDESADTFSAWESRSGNFGIVRLGSLKDIDNVLAIRSFEDQHGGVIRAWTGRELGELGERKVNAFWWLWPGPIVLRPWHAPGTWGELRRVGKATGIDVDAMMRWLFPKLRGANISSILMIGYPIPLRLGEAPNEVHWDALLLPRLAKAEGRPPSGFRQNARGWWRRDRFGKFADAVTLQYLYAENWSSDRLQARGRLPNAAREHKVALLGVGALGSLLAEMLIRTGIKSIALFDDEVVEAGNVSRHAATLADVGRLKVQTVAQRLRQISPAVRVEEFAEKLNGDAKAIRDALDEYDVIIDCTSSDEALAVLGAAWWPIPRLFASFSMGYGGKRLFSFGVSGHQFPHHEFAASVRPWLEHEGSAWADSSEVLEGAGCWSPLFPARHDDVVLAVATCVKELETIMNHRPQSCRFRVFAQSASNDGFWGYTLESAPPKVA